jgi:quinol monooxygenase YgiN
MIEHWTSAELLERHMGAASVSRLDALLEGNVTQRPELLFMEPLPAGDGTKGSLASVAARPI